MKTLLRHCQTKSVLPVLTSIYVKDGIAAISDCDFILSCAIDKPDGFYPVREVKADIWNRSEDLEFPIIAIPDVPSVDISVSVSDLSWISSAMSTEDVRYYLRGIYFDSEGLTATDGMILKHVNLPSLPISAILPDYAVKIIIDAAKEEKVSDVLIKFLGSVATVGIGKYSLTTKLIDGTYPPYEKVIPTDLLNKTAFNSEEFKPLLKKASALDKKLKSVMISGSLCFPEAMPAESVMISGYWKTPYMFNCQLLMDSDIIGEVYYSLDDTGPVKITSENRVCVVMPQRQIRR